MQPQDFINKLAPIAVKDMNQTGVLASLTIAQGILESNWGESTLTKQQNNLFGIKGNGGSYQTQEYINGKWITINANFRAFSTWNECVDAHSRLILNGTRDNPTRYHGVLNTDYKTACYEIWKSGYATDPNYPQKLINIIESYGLMKYDQKGGENKLDDLVNKIRVSVSTVRQIPLKEYSTKGSDVRIIKMNPSEWDIDFVVQAGKTTEQIAIANNADVAINGPFFMGGSIIAYSKNKTGVISYDGEPKVYPRYGFATKNGVPYIGSISGSDTTLDFAFKSSPLVVWEGKNVAKERMDIESTPDDIRARKPRPAIFLDKNNNITIAIIDGWTQKDEYKYDSGLNPIEVGDLGISLFNAWKGICFDGGGSTTLYVKGQGVINALQDGSPRITGHALIFKKKAIAPTNDWKQEGVDWLKSVKGITNAHDKNESVDFGTLGSVLQELYKNGTFKK